ncbi:MAG: TCR/Tet family MFS transporter [Verrucomicrobia bacterium]|nr:TCR/Tet family MFS transporter [Verrucomicrobiota bacterium]
MSSRRPALAFILVTLALDVLGIGVIIPILPKLVEQFEGGSVAEASGSYGLLSASYSLMQFGFAPLLGCLSDRFGRRPVILASLFGAGVDYFLMAWAPSLGWFFVARIISGVTGANFAAAAAYIADISPPEKRAAHFGLIGAAFGLGFILGPALGGFLGGYGLRVPFVVAGVITLLNWLYGWWVLPESLPPELRRRVSWDRANPVGALLRLGRYPRVLNLAAVHFLIQLAHQSLPSTWVLYTGYRYGWSVRQTGISLAIVGLMAAVVQGGLTRFLIPRLGEGRAVLMGLVVSAGSFAGYGLATEGWMIYAILIVGSLGGITNPAVQSWVSRSVGADEQGGVQGSLTSLASLAGVAGPPLMTWIFGVFVSDGTSLRLPGAAFFCSGLLVSWAAVMAWGILRRNQVEGVP